MARIEMNMDEYNGMKDRITQLEAETVQLRKQIELEQSKNDAADEKIEIVKSASWYDRVFKWKQILQLIEN